MLIPVPNCLFDINFSFRYLHWAFAVTSALGAVFVWLLVPETSGKTLEEIEHFFTHLRREAMDMIGDREACREPKKMPFFVVGNSAEDKNQNKAIEAGECGGTGCRRC